MTKFADLDVTAPQLAEVLNITARRVRQLAEESIFPKPARGRYPLAGCVQAYIATIEARGDSGDLRAERISLMRAQRRRIEIDNANKEGAGHDLDAQDAAVSVFANHLLLRLRPIGDWLFHELNSRGFDQAHEVAGTAANWIIGARAEIEEEITAALANARRRGVLISRHDDLVKLLGRSAADKPFRGGRSNGSVAEQPEECA